MVMRIPALGRGLRSRLGLGHPTATSSAGSASPSFSSAVGFAGSTSSTMSSPARALTASGPGRGRAPHGQVAFYSTLNEARNLVETPRMEAQRFGLGVNGVLLREWSSPSMDRNAGGRPPERRQEALEMRDLLLKREDAGSRPPTLGVVVWPRRD